MGRKKNDGRGRLGGRQKGTPNKMTALAKSMMENWLTHHNSDELIWKDFTSLAPQDRVRVSLEFIKMILPRSVNIEDANGKSIITIEDRLRELCEEDNAE